MGSDKLKEFGKRIAGQGEGSTELVPAATVVLLRDGEQGLETLMLRKNSKIAFGGMWVFPGGRIDPEDGEGLDDMVERARHAAVRESEEEVSLQVHAPDLHWFSHWTPPAMGNRRFSTWFFVARAPEAEVQIDDGEIIESQWLHPAEAIAQQASAKIELAPPTWVSLHYLSPYPDVASVLADLAHCEPRHYCTRIVAEGDELLALWEGDAGYETQDAQVPGPRHRLRLCQGGYQFEDSAV
jgi:8-oxo-dGTP pyrophosphatase MutT (NUDIX family)